MKKIISILVLISLSLFIISCNTNINSNTTITKCNNGLSWCDLKDKCIDTNTENCLGITSDPNNQCTTTDNISFSCVVNDTVVKINQLP